MQTHKLGYSDLYLSTIGLGTWAMAGRDFLFNIGDQNDQDSIHVIHRALDLGINWIDTAAVYGLGHSEEMVAKALKGKRNQVILATKCGIVWDGNGQNVRGNLKSDSIRWEAEQSLQRLNTDVIDLFQVHWPDPNRDLEEAWGTIADLIREGKVRYAGASNFSVEQLERVRHIHPVASLQPPYNLFERGIEEKILPYCAQHEIGVIPYSPLRVGLLSGKFTIERWRNLPADDWRRQYDDYRDVRVQINLEFVEKLRPIAALHKRPVSHIVIGWVLRRPEVTAVIVGARRPSQTEETALAADCTLTSSDLAEIENLLAEREQRLAEAGVLDPVFVEPHNS